MSFKSFTWTYSKYFSFLLSLIYSPVYINKILKPSIKTTSLYVIMKVSFLLIPPGGARELLPAPDGQRQDGCHTKRRFLHHAQWGSHSHTRLQRYQGNVWWSNRLQKKRFCIQSLITVFSYKQSKFHQRLWNILYILHRYFKSLINSPFNHYTQYLT